MTDVVANKVGTEELSPLCLNDRLAMIKASASIRPPKTPIEIMDFVATMAETAETRTLFSQREVMDFLLDLRNMMLDEKDAVEIIDSEIRDNTWVNIVKGGDFLGRVLFLADVVEQSLNLD